MCEISELGQGLAHRPWNPLAPRSPEVRLDDAPRRIACEGRDSAGVGARARPPLASCHAFSVIRNRPRYPLLMYEVHGMPTTRLFRCALAPRTRRARYIRKPSTGRPIVRVADVRSRVSRSRQSSSPRLSNVDYKRRCAVARVLVRATTRRRRGALVGMLEVAARGRRLSALGDCYRCKRDVFLRDEVAPQK